MSAHSDCVISTPTRVPIAFATSFFVTFVVAGAAAVPGIQILPARWADLALWSDPLCQQISGFALFSLILVAFLLPRLRRQNGRGRIHGRRARFQHAIIGWGALLLFAAHTGLHLGAHLTWLCGISFLALISLGGMAGFAATISSSGTNGTGRRRWIGLAHVLLFAPTLALSLLHLFAIYYY